LQNIFEKAENKSMQTAKHYAPLKERMVVLLANSLLAYVIFVFSAGFWLPTGGLESVWLLSALSFWFLALLSAPWFVPPRDGVVNGVGALLILITMDLSQLPMLRSELEIFRWLSALFAASVVVLALVALFLFDHDKRSPKGTFAFRLTGIFGGGEILFTPPALICAVGAFQPNIIVATWLLLLWVVLVVGRPVERIAAAWRQLKMESGELGLIPSVGIIDRVDHPNIVRVKLTNGSTWKSNRLHTASMPDGTQQFVISLFSQIQGSDVVGTGLCVATVAEPLTLPSGEVCSSHDEMKTAEFIEGLSGVKGSELVGFTVENSTISVLRFEVATESHIEEGEVVFAKINGRDVFFQIIDAETAEENFDQNPRGTYIVRAAQIGCYEPESGFTKFPWLPGMNTPLFAARNRIFPDAIVTDRQFKIGTVPFTNVSVVADIDDLVEYHTAILGVTGTGKTELVLDLVREAIARGVKVFCVDFTGEYRHRLADLGPIFPAPSREQALDLENKLFAVETGAYGAPAEKKALKEGIEALRKSTAQQVTQFLESKDNNLAVLELSEITNTKATLRFTELYLSTIMSWAREHRRARQVMIVLEEAHTIVPEVFGSGFDSETQYVVSRIGQIALQGRKYGVGLLIVTQRTALVSKTILSQCNTFFTHTLIDQTSLTFLESVYSSQHTRLIPNLRKFEYLAYGKALKAERPILLRREFDQAKKDASDALRRPLQDVALVEPALEIIAEVSDEMTGP
jgi:uncharacterized protein